MSECEHCTKLAAELAQAREQLEASRIKRIGAIDDMMKQRDAAWAERDRLEQIITEVLRHGNLSQDMREFVLKDAFGGALRPDEATR